MVSRTRRALTVAEASGDSTKAEQLREKLKTASAAVKASKSIEPTAAKSDQLPQVVVDRGEAAERAWSDALSSTKGDIAKLKDLEFERELTEARQGSLDLRRQRDRAQRAGARQPSGPGVAAIEQRARDAEAENVRRIDARRQALEANRDLDQSTSDNSDSVLRKEIMELDAQLSTTKDPAARKQIEDRMESARQRLRASQVARRRQLRTAADQVAAQAQPPTAPAKSTPKRTAAPGKRRATTPKVQDQVNSRKPEPGGEPAQPGPVSGKMSSTPIAENGWGV